jgi:hypothetical protein
MYVRMYNHFMFNHKHSKVTLQLIFLQGYFFIYTFLRNYPLKVYMLCKCFSFVEDPIVSY